MTASAGAYHFRKAVRTNTSVLIALAGSSGSGKTFSALRIARGLVGPQGKIAVVDTEAGRALYYADYFDFDHLDLSAPFTPDAYHGAIRAAESEHYGVVVVDSWSHVWAGDGGVTDQCEEALHEMVQRAMQKNPRADEYTLTEALKGSAWRGKIPYKRMVQRLVQSRTHLIFCLRAEPKIKFVKERDESGRERTKIIDAGWQPICEKNFMFEVMVSFMLTDERPGVGLPIKLQDQHKPCFPGGELLDEQAGEQLAAWASGGAAKPPVRAPTDGRTVPVGDDDELAREREARLALCKRFARERKWTKGQWDQAWQKACDRATEANVDLSALANLERAIRGAA